MDNQDKTFNTICRVCLNHEKLDRMVSLIDTSKETGLSLYGSALEEITKISLKHNQYLPMNLCKKCKESLEGFSKFIFACKVSNKQLKKLIKFSLNQDLDGAMVKEVVRQYTLFRQNIPEDSRTLKQSNPSQNDQDMTEKQVLADVENPNNHVGVEVQAVNSSSCSEDPDNNDNVVKNPKRSHKNGTDVDIFIESIKKLVTTYCEDIKTEIETSNKTTKKKDITKPKKKIKPNVEALTCNVCYKVLATEKTFKNHVQRHGLCRFVCDQCGKGFPINAELVQHQIHSHGAASQYECDICSYRAVKKIQLIEHIRIHTGERPFTCEKCGATFRRKTLFNKHAKFHGEKTVQCESCPRKFYVRSAMLAHKNSRHNREYTYSCRICNVTYAMARTVKKHMLDKHGIPKHLQGKVQKMYKRNLTDGSTNFSEGG